MRASEAYRRQQRNTASTQSEIPTLFGELVQTLAEARSAIESSRLEDAHSRLVLAQQVLAGLRTGLPPEPRDLVQNLSALYLHCEQLLVRANLDKSVADIDQALGVLSVLRDAWQEAAQIVQN